MIDRVNFLFYCSSPLLHRPLFSICPSYTLNHLFPPCMAHNTFKAPGFIPVCEDGRWFCVLPTHANASSCAHKTPTAIQKGETLSLLFHFYFGSISFR